ncbi:MAG: toll/interleukin-1 receptor domain-containing protein [Geminicoccaceae bacterium]
MRTFGFDPWLDEIDLLPGQAWKEEIPKAIAGAKVFLACLSSQSIDKVGYVQTELRHALTAFGRHPPGAIYLIPVRLDQCRIPDFSIPDLALGLKDIQWVDLFDDDGLDRLILAIQRALGEASTAPENALLLNRPQSAHAVASTGYDLEVSRTWNAAQVPQDESDIKAAPLTEQWTGEQRFLASRGGGTRYADLKIDLWEDPAFRRECVARLKGAEWGEFYRQALGEGIAWADRFFGAPFSYRAFGTCLVIAVIYGYLGLSIAYILGGPGIWISPDLMPRIGSFRDDALSGLVWLAAATFAWLIGFGSGRFERRRRKRWLQERRRRAGNPIRPDVDVGYHLRSAGVTIGVIGLSLGLMGFADSDSSAFLMQLFQMPVIPAVLLLVTALATRARGACAGLLALLGGAMASMVLSGLLITSAMVAGASGMFVIATAGTTLILVGTILATGVVLASAAPLAIILMMGIAEAISQGVGSGELVVAGETFELTRSGLDTIVFMAIWALGVSQGFWPIMWRLGWAAAVGCYLAFGVLGAIWATSDEQRFIILAGITLFTMLPLLNGLLDMVSWLWTRWLAGRLHDELLRGRRVEARAATVLGHTFADLALAIFALILLAWLLAFAFELYGQAGLAGPVDAEHGSYVRPMIEDAIKGPWQNGFWVWLILLSTLVPTMIHMIFLLAAPLAVIALPDRRRLRLVERLEAFDHASREEQTTTVRKVATYMARERSVIWIVAAGCVAIGPAGLIFALVHLTDWQPFEYVGAFLYEVALSAIGTALFLTGR